ncbi:hypothetical protein K523DRAFT_315668 [Schizophyllum commune Tattone D]|nr:hypothetical protein K523DRAFT_315668 [Schizophyllum commune Tattone D]
MLALFFCFTAFVLLLFVTISSPTWDSISFLNVSTDYGSTHFGVFGFSGGKVHVGFHFLVPVIGYDYLAIEGSHLHALTYTLVLYPIATGISASALVAGVGATHNRRAGTIIMTLLAGLALLLALAAWVLSMVLFGTARSRFDEQGIDAAWGNANWVGLGALVALLVAFVAAWRGRR